jgi:hypothetical protein
MSSRTCGRPPHNDMGLAVVHHYSRHVKMACDDLHDNPFDEEARAQILAIIAAQNLLADAVVSRRRKSARTRWRPGEHPS